MPLSPDNNKELQLAPIVLLVYNRPSHTRKTLNALSVNVLADKSTLYIYADGPKEGATELQLKNIAEVRELIREKKWCHEVKIIEAEKNKGLANSVIDGVTEIVNKYDKIIVLEDDLITAKGFLKYMNEALQKYEKYESVMQISGYSFSSEEIHAKQSSFFTQMTTSWGWATWKRAWCKFDINAIGYEILKTDKNLEFSFNLDGAFSPYSQMLFDQMETQKINSWAIRWWWSVFKEKGITLFPDKSLVKNIGFDSEGTHTQGRDPFPIKDFDVNYFITDFPTEIKNHSGYFDKFKSYIRNPTNNTSVSKVGILKSTILSRIRYFFK